MSDLVEKNIINDNEIEFRLKDVFDFLKKNNIHILKWICFFFAIGVLYSVVQYDEYTSSVRVMPELKSGSNMSNLGDLKSLAGIAGINLDNVSGSSDAIRPDLYPDIVQSLPFVSHLLKQRINAADGSTYKSLQEYLIAFRRNTFLQRFKLFWTDESKDLIVEAIRGDSLFVLTEGQEKLSREISRRVVASIDKKSGIVTITSQMPDPLVSAIVARNALNYLIKYVTSYRTEKARKQVQFLTQQVNEVRRRYEGAELALSSYRDRNRNLFLNTAKIEEQRLQANFLLIQDLYNNLNKQLEQARIQVQQESPVFQVLDPAQVPTRKSGPKRLVQIAAFSLIGLVLGIFSSVYISVKKSL